jgi:hypothetical protein
MVNWDIIWKVLTYVFAFIGIIITLKDFYSFFLYKRFRNISFLIADKELKVVFTKIIYLKDDFTQKKFNELISLLKPKTSELNYRNFEPYENYVNLSFKGVGANIRISYLQDHKNGKILKIQTINDIIIGYRKFRDFDAIISKLSTLYGVLERVNTDIKDCEIITNIELDVDGVTEETHKFSLDKYDAKVLTCGSKIMITAKSLASMKTIIKSAIKKWNSIR